MKTVGIHFTKFEKGDTLSCYDLTNLLIVNTLKQNDKLDNQVIVEITDLFGNKEFLSEIIEAITSSGYKNDIIYCTISLELIKTFIGEDNLEDAYDNILKQMKLITELNFKFLNVYLKDLYTEGDQIPVSLYVYNNEIGNELIKLIKERPDVIINEAEDSETIGVIFGGKE